jgi:hypothetical protein
MSPFGHQQRYTNPKLWIDTHAVESPKMGNKQVPFTRIGDIYGGEKEMGTQMHGPGWKKTVRLGWFGAPLILESGVGPRSAPAGPPAAW